MSLDLQATIAAQADRLEKNRLEINELASIHEQTKNTLKMLRKLMDEVMAAYRKADDRASSLSQQLTEDRQRHSQALDSIAITVGRLSLENRELRRERDERIEASYPPMSVKYPT